MFAARTLRPLRAVARRAYATAAAARPHSGPLHKPPTPPSGGQQLALVGAAGAALFAAGYTVSELRKKNVIVTEKEDEEIEEAVDEVVEEAVEEAEEAEPQSAGAAALEAMANAADQVDSALAALVAEAEGALGITSSAPTALPDPAQAASEGAFNEETGEINWDCPCLGGMASGPCGEEFKAAFSCFVYSEAEPKGVDCVDKFKAMQDCFREHPDVYGEEIDDDDEPVEETKA